MKKFKFVTITIVALAFFTVLVAYAETNDNPKIQRIKPQGTFDKSQKEAGPKQLIKKTVSTFPDKRVEPVVPEKSSPFGLQRDYEMVTDVLDGFGRASSSRNYRIPVNSGGQPTAIGVSFSTNYVVKSGYVYSSYVYRGDVNADGIINVGDIVYLVSYLYRGGPEPSPWESGDVNCDGIINVGDIVYLVSYLYRGGPPPAC